MQPNPENQSEPDELDRLIWSLLDETIDQKEIEALEECLESSQEARERYIACCSLHTDLVSEFRVGREQKNQPESPVLRSLGGFQGIDDRPPVT